MKRDERGFIQALVAVGVVFSILGAAVAVAVVQKVMLDKGSTYTVSAPFSAPSNHFIGPPPAGGDQGECQLKWARGRGTSWVSAAQGWRAPVAWPEPAQNLDGPIEDAATMRGRWRAWEDGISGLVKSIQSDPEWIECAGRQAPPKPALAEPKPKITGSYLFDFDIGSCLGRPLPLLQGIVNESPFSIGFQAAPGTKPDPTFQIQVVGTFDPDLLTFRAQHEQTREEKFLFDQVGTTKVYFRLEIEGRFDVFDGHTIIREGRGEVTIRFDNGTNPPCKFSYSVRIS